VSPENVIGEYLRVRRGLVRPEDVELPSPTGRRQVRGLRREEVALLAGVSIEYYIRLEQGRDRHPSGQVIDALARALQLDQDATAYLHRLAGSSPRTPSEGSPPETAPEGIRKLIASLHERPALVLGRYMDILAVNPLATALYPYCVEGANVIRTAFLDPRVREIEPDWEQTAENAVLTLRASVGPDVDDQRVDELVSELSLSSERFRELWARHDVRPRRSGTRRIEHPQVGTLELHLETLIIPDTDRQYLSICHVAPGSHSARALKRLATATADQHDAPAFHTE
jgi:transcriptional regulator with XRE-family HTH domain